MRKSEYTITSSCDSETCSVDSTIHTNYNTDNNLTTKSRWTKKKTNIEV